MNGSRSTNPTYIVSYSNKFRFLLTTHVPLILIFWAVLAFMIHEGTLETWYAVRPGRYAFDVMIAKILFAGTVIDVMFTVLRIIFVRKALVMSPEGIQGMHSWIWRRFMWDEVDYVRKSLNNLFIVRKPKTLWERVSRKGTVPGSRYRREVMIVVPLKCVDQSEADIRDVIRYFCGRDVEVGLNTNAKAFA